MQSEVAGKKLLAYKRVVVKQNVFAPHSYLYHLEPSGLGTPHVESLTSYFTRLAVAHSITSGQLVAHIVGPLVRKIQSENSEAENRNGKGVINYFSSSHSLNAGRWRTGLWVRALEALTLRNDLIFLTTLPWGSAISQSKLYRRSKAWCPACLEQLYQNGGAIYEPLLWSLSVVTICPIHQCEMEQLCHHCEKRSDALSGYSRVGHCSRCRSWLGRGDKLKKPLRLRDFEFRLWAAENVSEWIRVAWELPSPLSFKNMAQIIRVCINLFAEGKAVTLAERINVSTGIISSWLSGRYRPWLSDLLKICHIGDISLAKLLAESASDYININNISSSSDKVKKASHFRLRKKAQVKQALEAALGEEPAPSMYEIAVRLNYKTKNSLRIMFPTLYKKLAERYRSSGRCPRSQRNKITEFQLKEISRELKAALRQDPTSSLPQVAKKLRLKVKCNFHYRFPDLCRQIVRQRAEQKRKKLSDIKASLRAVLREDQPPDLSTVAKRFDYTSSAHLSRRFPELCRAIIERRLRWKPPRTIGAPKALQNALWENPPPSLAEVARRQGCCTGWLRIHYPKLCCTVVTRRSVYRRQARLELLSATKEEVRNIATDLIRQGLYPSGERVIPLLKNPGNPGFMEVTKVLREFRQEMNLKYG